jgi:uncharacterized membrane protein YfcA
MISPLTALVALALGLGMGVLGGGGSIVAVPVLTFVVGFAPKDAVVASLAIVAVAASAGAASALMRGVLPVRLALTVGVSAVAGGTAGGAIGARLSDHLQLILLAIVMFGAAIVMWRLPAPATGEQQPAALRLGAIGLVTGAITGLVGVGGGFLIVPALAATIGLPMRRAAAASLFVMTLAALAALLRYTGQATLHWAFVAPFAAIAAAGSVAGGLVAHRLPQRRLQQGFSVALVILGSFLLLKA